MLACKGIKTTHASFKPSPLLVPVRKDINLRRFSAQNKVPVTIAEGDGIGPEITKATVNLIEAAGAKIDWEKIEVGEKVYLRGQTSGIENSAWDSIRKTKVMLKAPISTPSGGGYKSLNVTLRKTLGLYANVRPCLSYHPFVHTKHPNMDVVIVRENEEDLYAGIEHHQTDQVVQCLKLISRPGCERIVSYAFEYARRNNRKKVSAFVKDNIMKMTDGLFAEVFEEIGSKYYPEIQRDRWIVDIGAARLADTPEMFDVVVMANLYGDILSDVAAQITGSVGLGGSANIGDSASMFEAIHGSAPPIAGKDIANPSGMILSAVMMLNHIGQSDVAEKVHNAWLKTLEDGIHTADIYREGLSKRRVGTRDFGKAIVENLGKTPFQLKPVNYTTKSSGSWKDWTPIVSQRPDANKVMVGIDVFLHWNPKKGRGDAIAQTLATCAKEDLKLTLITNRGVKVWPGGFPETFCTDHWRCRFKSPDNKPVNHENVIHLLDRVQKAGFDFIKTENLYLHNGKPGFSLGQGE